MDNSVKYTQAHAVVQAGSVAGGVHVHVPAAQVLPRQLPDPPRLFTGRTRDLIGLGASPISVVTGPGGIGKTWLALHWAHQHLDRFPDGQLYVNLRGFDPSSTPVSPAVAVRGFLDAFQVDPIPVDLDAQAAMYRSLTAGKRMLIVLDNARDTAQVTPLLPGSPTCTVIVTSRHQLTGLVATHSAAPRVLDVLDDAEARELITKSLGTQPEQAVGELLEQCCGLPLALGIAIARAVTQPHLPLSLLVDELREARLDAGEDGADLRAVFSWSYQALSDAETTAMGLLASVPAPDISLAAATSLFGRPAAKTLRRLENAHLVQQHAPGRYRMHDLIRLHARENAEPDPEALHRLSDFYLHSAYGADRRLYGGRELFDRPTPVPGCVPVEHASPDAALAWFDAEHACLLATQAKAVADEWHVRVWQFAQVLDGYHIRRGHHHDNVASMSAGMAAADRVGDKRARTFMRRGLGQALITAGRPEDGLRLLREALVIAEESDDPRGLATSHYNVAQFLDGRQDHTGALAHMRQALTIARTIGDTELEALTLNGVGWLQAHIGELDSAHEHCMAALAIYRAMGAFTGEANTIDTIGLIAQLDGRHEDAVTAYRRALELYDITIDEYFVPYVLEHLGDAHLALGRRDEASEALSRARELFLAQHKASDAGRVERKSWAVSGESRPR